MKITLVLVLLLVFSTVPLGYADTGTKPECRKIGDTVTVRGRAIGFMNGGTYFEPLKPFCVDFPKSVYNGIRMTPSHLTTVGPKVQPDIYVEVTGILRDAYPEYGVAFEVMKVRNVDAEVKSDIDAANKRCQQWRQENIPTVKEKMHGGTVAPYEANNGDITPRCGLIAVDSISHEVVTIWMPESKK